MKKSLAKLALCLAVITLTVSGAAAAKAPGTRITVNEATLKRMSVFLSNFTELRFLEIDSPSAMSHKDLVRFGIWHNDVNNFQSRVTHKADQHGDLIIEARWVAESVRKYFDLELQHGSVPAPTSPYSPYDACYYDGKFYHYYGASGDAAYHARVRDVFQLPDGNIRMTGELYNPDHEDGTAAYSFEAVAKPYKFGGKDTWSIVSLHTQTD